MLKAFVASLILTIALLAGVLWALDSFLHAPLNKSETMVKYVLAPGTGAKSMIRQLKKEGIINQWQATLLRSWIQYKGVEKFLKAGEYQFSLSITPEMLLKKLIDGDVVQYTVTFIEGNTFSDTMDIIARLPSIKKVLTGKSPQEIMALLGEPLQHPEGLFFPDTYYFTANMSDLNLLQRMRTTMRSRLQNAWDGRDTQVYLKTPYEALILASIIEKEAVVDDERSLISGVFQRRLATNMRLQADPTVIYGLGKTYSERLTKADLKQDTPYNTYVKKGLPPTPIAMPGMKAIVAALHPDKGDALYFVAKGDGKHYFSNSLKEHNQAVAKYQLNTFAFHYNLGQGVQWTKEAGI